MHEPRLRGSIVNVTKSLTLGHTCYLSQTVADGKGVGGQGS